VQDARLGVSGVDGLVDLTPLDLGNNPACARIRRWLPSRRRPWEQPRMREDQSPTCSESTLR
jgi:hypothetical protein